MNKQENLESLKIKLFSVLYGLVIGDALGVPVEFEERDTYSVVDMVGYGTLWYVSSASRYLVR